MNGTLEAVATTLVAEGKGILAADESVGTLARRFDAIGILSTEGSRRAYREMLFTAPGASEFIGGAILHDETIRQRSLDGPQMADLLSRQGILPGIKVDTGTVPLPGSPEETVTEGLDGLRDRLSAYRPMGARFSLSAFKPPMPGPWPARGSTIMKGRLRGSNSPSLGMIRTTP